MGNKKSSELYGNSVLNALKDPIQRALSLASCKNQSDIHPLLFGLTFLNLSSGRQDLVPLTLVKISAEVKSFIASVTMTQFYKNIRSGPIECEYHIPIDEEAVITSIDIKFDDGREVKVDVQPHQKAQQQDTEATESGHTEPISRANEPNRMMIKVGNLASNSKVQVMVRYITPLYFHNSHWRLILPKSMTPLYTMNHRFVDEDIEQSLDFPVVIAQTCPYKIGILIILSTTSSIRDLSCPSHDIIINFGNGSKSASVILNPSKLYIPHRDFLLQFITDDAYIPRVIIEECNESYTGMLSFVPRYSEISEEVETPGEFLLLIDRSSSMKDRMKLTLSTATHFLSNLPMRSKFNIISFGTEFESLFEISEVYSRDTMNEAVNKIEKFDASMGDKEILAPLAHIFNLPNELDYPRSLFILTDGAFGNYEEVVQLVSEKAGDCRVHIICIGYGVDTYLIRRIAKAGKGSVSFVNISEELQETVITAIKKATVQPLTSMNLAWNANLVPDPGYSSTLCYNEPFVVYAQGDNLLTEEISLQAWNPRFIKWEIYLVSPEELYLSKGENLRKLWGKHMIRDLEHRLSKGKDVKGEIERLSIELKIPSSQAEYVATELKYDPDTGELQERAITIISTEKHYEILEKSEEVIIKPETKEAPPESEQKVVEPASKSNNSTGIFTGLFRKKAQEIPVPEEKKTKPRFFSRLFKRSNKEVAKESQAEKTAPSPESKHVNTEYTKIIDSIELEGCWNLKKLRKVIKVPEIPNSLLKMKNNRRIWATLIGLVYLEKQYASNKKEWSLPAEKARRWLKSKRVEDTLFEVAEISMS
jgi:hypothetical protein